MKIKTFNQLNKIKEHIKNKEFGLKDYDKTLNKYSKYKRVFVERFFKLNENEFKEHLKDLNYFIGIEIQNNFRNEHFKQIENLNKANINNLSTHLNGIVFNLNKSFIENSLNETTNFNTINNLTIIFYLKYYKELNKIMNKSLNEFYFNEFKILNINNKIDFKKYKIIEVLN